MQELNDGLPAWPAPERNKGPILDVLHRVLPDDGTVLEVASGSGQHAVHFARALPRLTWQPSDHDEENLQLVEARVQRAALPNLRGPLSLDVRDEAWPVQRAHAIFNANMIHIAPWSVTEGLMAGAGRLLATTQVLITYGPYRIDGAHTAESNARFDASLKQRDPSWGVRDLVEVEQVAGRHGLRLRERIAMPANNFTMVWERD